MIFNKKSFKIVLLRKDIERKILNEKSFKIVVFKKDIERKILNEKSVKVVVLITGNNLRLHCPLTFRLLF